MLLFVLFCSVKGLKNVLLSVPPRLARESKVLVQVTKVDVTFFFLLNLFSVYKFVSHDLSQSASMCTISRIITVVLKDAAPGRIISVTGGGGA